RAHGVAPTARTAVRFLGQAVRESDDIVRVPDVRGSRVWRIAPLAGGARLALPAPRGGARRMTDPVRWPRVAFLFVLVAVVFEVIACGPDDPDPPDPSSPSGASPAPAGAGVDPGWRGVLDDDSGRTTFLASPSPAERAPKADNGRFVADAPDRAHAFVAAHPELFGLAALPGALALRDVTADDLG